MGKYLDIARKFDAKRQEEDVALPPQSVSAWACPHCGNPAEIEAVEPSLDGTQTLTYWHCETCAVWAVTPSTLREPPVWVRRSEH